MPLVALTDVETDSRTAYSHPLSAVAGGDPLLIAQKHGSLWQAAADDDVTDEKAFRPWVRRPSDDSESGFAQDRPHLTLLADGLWQFEEHATDSVEHVSRHLAGGRHGIRAMLNTCGSLLTEGGVPSR